MSEYFILFIYFFVEFCGSRMWQQLCHISVWFLSVLHRQLCSLTHGSFLLLWREIEKSWLISLSRPSANLQMLRMESRLSNLKSFSHYSSESIYPTSPFSTPLHLSHFLCFTFMSAFPTTIMLLLALLVLTHKIDSDVSFFFVTEMFCFFFPALIFQKFTRTFCLL